MVGAITAASVTLPSTAPASAASVSASSVSANQIVAEPQLVTGPGVTGQGATSALALGIRQDAYEQGKQAAKAAAATAAQAAKAAAAEKAAAAKAQAQAKTQTQAKMQHQAAGSPQQIAEGMLGQFGWSGSQFSCLDPLWAHESGWSVTATNAGSGAYGIPQALPGSKMGSVGPDWQANAATQIRWGLNYIQGTYGSPCAAWSHEESDGWY